MWCFSSGSDEGYVCKAIDDKRVHVTAMSLFCDFLCSLHFKWQSDKWWLCTKLFNFSCKIHKYKLKWSLGSYLLFSSSLATEDLSQMSVGHIFQYKYTTINAWFEVHHRRLRQEHMHCFFLTFCASLLKALLTFSIILSFFFSISVEGSVLRTRVFFPQAFDYVPGCRTQRDILGCFPFADVCQVIFVKIDKQCWWHK